MTSGFLALRLRNELSDELRSLLVELAKWAHPAHFDQATQAWLAAAIVDDVRSIGFLPVSVPYALWIGGQTDVPLEITSDPRVRVVLSPRAEVADAAGAKGRYIPPAAFTIAPARPVPPFVRARLRHARGLPATAIASVDEGALTWCGAPCMAELADTAFGLAAAVAVRGADVVRALAWAAPCAVDTATAAAHGLEHDMQVLVSDSPLGTAQRLAADPLLAARLSQAGRHWYEARADIERVATVVARDLDLLPSGFDRLPALIRELGGHDRGRTAVRAAELVR